MIWRPCKRTDPLAVEMYRRHYSFDGYAKKVNQIGSPCAYLALINRDMPALFLWEKPKSEFRADKRIGISCAIFRNEGLYRSSDLILDAMDWSVAKWGESPYYTFVNPSRILSANPGFCFKVIGWRFTGTTKAGLHVLEYP